MSVKTIIEEIKTATQAEVEEILKKAKDEANKIIDEARRKAERIKEVKIKDKMTEVEMKVAAKLAGIRIEGRRKTLSVKSKYLDEVISKTEEELSKIAEKGGKDYAEVLKNFISEAVANLDSEELIVYANERDKSLVSDVINQLKKEMRNRNVKLSLANESIDTSGGIIVQSADGRQIFNNTFEARLIKLKDELRGKILTILFGE